MKFNKLLRFFDTGWSLVGFGPSVMVQGYVSDPVVDDTSFEDTFHFFGDGLRTDIILERDDFIAQVGGRVVMLVVPNSRRREEWALASPFVSDVVSCRKELFSYCNDLSILSLKRLGGGCSKFGVFSVNRSFSRWNLEGALMNDVVLPKSLKLLTESDEKSVYGIQAVSNRVDELLKSRYRVHVDFFGKNLPVFSRRRKYTVQSNKRYVFWFMGPGKRSKPWHLQYKHRISTTDFYSKLRSGVVYTAYFASLRSTVLRQLFQRKKYQVRSRAKSLKKKRRMKKIASVLSRGFATFYEKKKYKMRNRKGSSGHFFAANRSKGGRTANRLYKFKQKRRSGASRLLSVKELAKQMQLAGHFVGDIAPDNYRGRFATYCRKYRRYRRQYIKEFYIKLAGDKVNRFVIKGLKLRVGCRSKKRRNLFLASTRSLRALDRLKFRNIPRSSFVAASSRDKLLGLEGLVCYSKDKFLSKRLFVRFQRFIKKYFLRRKLTVKNLKSILNFMKVKFFELRFQPERKLLSSGGFCRALTVSALGASSLLNLIGSIKFLRLARLRRRVTLFFARKKAYLRSNSYKKWLVRCNLNKVHKKGTLFSRNLWVYLLKAFFVNGQFAGIKGVFAKNSSQDLRRYFCILKSKVLLRTIEKILTGGVIFSWDFRTIKYLFRNLLNQVKVLIRNWNLLVLARSSVGELPLLIKEVLHYESRLRSFLLNSFVQALSSKVKNVYWDFTRADDFRYKLEFKGKNLKPYGFKLTNLMLSEDAISILSVLKKFELCLAETFVFLLCARKGWSPDFVSENVLHLRLISAQDFSKRSVMRYVELITRSIYKLIVTDDEDEEQLKEFERVIKDFKQETAYIDVFGDLSFESISFGGKELSVLPDYLEEEEEVLVEEFRYPDDFPGYWNFNVGSIKKFRVLARMLNLLPRHEDNRSGGDLYLELNRFIGITDHGSLMERTIRKEWLKMLKVR